MRLTRHSASVLSLATCLGATACTAIAGLGSVPNPVDGGASDGAGSSSGSGSPDGASSSGSGGDSGAVALVQQITGSTSGNTNPVTLTLPSPPTSGDALVLAISASGEDPSNVSGGGVTWMKRASSGEHFAVSVWTGFDVAPGASTTVTLTWSQENESFAGVLTEWRGLSEYVQGQTAFGEGSTIATPSVGANPGDLVLAAAGMDGNEENNSVEGLAGGFTALQYPTIADDRAVVAYLLPSSAGTFEATWTDSVSDGWDAVIVGLGP